MSRYTAFEILSVVYYIDLLQPFIMRRSMKNVECGNYDILAAKHFPNSPLRNQGKWLTMYNT